MKKTIAIIALAVCTLFTPSKAKAQFQSSNIDVSTSVLGAVAGTGFIVAGILQQPDRTWVVDPNAVTYNSYGQHGYWKNEKIWQDPGRSACILSGVAILTVSITYRF